MNYTERATRRQTRYLNSLLGTKNGGFIPCHHCDKEFYPLKSSCFCTIECARDAFREIASDNNIRKLSYVEVLEMLAVVEPKEGETMEELLSHVRKIAQLAAMKDRLFS